MPDKTCSVVGCDRPFRCSGYCGLHYGRMLTKGTTGDPPPRPTECSVDCCDAPVAGWGWCRKHYYRWKRTGRLADPERRTDITYTAAHLRVFVARGSASKHSCTDCGAPAAEWSYSHRDPNALSDPIGRAYSLDISMYEARCKRCHRTLDSHGRAMCGIDGCAEFVKARGLCSRHYQRAVKLNRPQMQREQEAG